MHTSHTDPYYLLVALGQQVRHENSIALKNNKPTLDAAQRQARNELQNQNAQRHIARKFAYDAAAVMSVWLGTDGFDLDPTEGLGDRLYALTIGIVDYDTNDAISDDEQEALAIIREAQGNYLKSRGIEDALIFSLINEYDNSVAANVYAELEGSKTDPLDAIDDFITSPASKIVYDSLVQTCKNTTYASAHAEERAVAAVYDRASEMQLGLINGKKTWVKRYLGQSRLTAKQKAARARARKNTSAFAIFQRSKALAKGAAMGLLGR